MIVFIGTSSTGPHLHDHQILELVVVTTTDDFELKKVSPSYVLYRPPGGPISPDRYAQHSTNNLLTEAAMSHRRPIHVEDLLQDQFGRYNTTMLKSTVVYKSSDDYAQVKKHFPSFCHTMEGKVVFYNDFADPIVTQKSKQNGRAMEDLLIVISETKRLRPW